MSPRHKKRFVSKKGVTFLLFVNFGQMETEPGSVSTFHLSVSTMVATHHLVSYQLELPRCCSNTLVTEPWSISTKLLSIAKARHVPKDAKICWNAGGIITQQTLSFRSFFQIALKGLMMLVAVFHPATGIYKNPKKRGSYVLALTSLWLDFAQPFYSQLSGSLPPARAKAP